MATFKSRKVGDIEVLADGVIPMYAVRYEDEWTVSANAPLAEPLPAWLFDAFGGRWKRP